MGEFLYFIKKELKAFLFGEIRLYCENCEKLCVIYGEDRMKLGIKNVLPPPPALKNYKCPGCGTPYGKNFYIVNF